MVPRVSSVLIDSAAARLQMSYWVAVCGYFLVCATLVTACGANTQSTASEQPKSDLLLSPRPTKVEHAGNLSRLFVGRPAPALDSLVTVGGQPTPTWPAMRGRVVVLDFWSPWCGVCHLVADDLNEWQQEFGARIQVIGIATGSPQH